MEQGSGLPAEDRRALKGDSYEHSEHVSFEYFSKQRRREMRRLWAGALRQVCYMRGNGAGASTVASRRLRSDWISLRSNDIDRLSLVAWTASPRSRLGRVQVLRTNRRESVVKHRYHRDYMAKPATARCWELYRPPISWDCRAVIERLPVVISVKFPTSAKALFLRSRWWSTNLASDNLARQDDHPSSSGPRAGAEQKTSITALPKSSERGVSADGGSTTMGRPGGRWVPASSNHFVPPQAPISSAVTNSARTSSVCSPNSGGRAPSCSGARQRDRLADRRMWRSRRSHILGDAEY